MKPRALKQKRNVAKEYTSLKVYQILISKKAALSFAQIIKKLCDCSNIFQQALNSNLEPNTIGTGLNTYETDGGRTKQPILNETKPPISKRDKTAGSKLGQKRRFCKKEQSAIKIASLIKASWPNYR